VEWDVKPSLSRPVVEDTYMHDQCVKFLQYSEYQKIIIRTQEITECIFGPQCINTYLNACNIAIIL